MPWTVTTLKSFVLVLLPSARGSLIRARLVILFVLSKVPTQYLLHLSIITKFPEQTVPEDNSFCMSQRSQDD
jgi:hypothetical protein